VAERRRDLQAGATKRAALVVDVAAEVENQRKRLELMDSEVWCFFFRLNTCTGHAWQAICMEYPSQIKHETLDLRDLHSKALFSSHSKLRA